MRKSFLPGNRYFRGVVASGESLLQWSSYLIKVIVTSGESIFQRSRCFRGVITSGESLLQWSSYLIKVVVTSGESIFQRSRCFSGVITSGESLLSKVVVFVILLYHSSKQTGVIWIFNQENC